MTRQDYIVKLSNECESNGITGISKKALETIVKLNFQLMQDVLVKGESFKWIGFGTFAPVVRAARQGRNPQTGQTIQLPETTKVKFTISKMFKEALNK